MRITQAEKMDIIRLVETSSVSIKQTLAELDVPCSTFYHWYLQYQEMQPLCLADRKAGPHPFWNLIPQGVREQVVQTALEHQEKSPRELAWYLTAPQRH